MEIWVEQNEMDLKLKEIIPTAFDFHYNKSIKSCRLLAGMGSCEPWFVGIGWGCGAKSMPIARDIRTKGSSTEWENLFNHRIRYSCAISMLRQFRWAFFLCGSDDKNFYSCWHPRCNWSDKEGNFTVKLLPQAQITRVGFINLLFIMHAWHQKYMQSFYPST